MIPNDIQEVIIEKDLFALGSDQVADYVAHIYCAAGSCVFGFNDEEFTIQAGDCAIVTITKLVYDVRMSEDFAVTVIYVHNTFLLQSAPESNYGVKGVMSLYHNPVMSLDERHRQICENDFRMVEYRLHDTGHHFHKEALSSALRTLFLDYFDFHVREEGSGKAVTDIQATLVMRFLGLLEGGEYKVHRDIGHYADRLCVSVKHLSATCKKVSGFSANYWISRFTILDIRRRLNDVSLTLGQIADDFNFSSQAHFSRYVYNLLGKYPSEYREK